MQGIDLLLGKFEAIRRASDELDCGQVDEKECDEDHPGYNARVPHLDNVVFSLAYLALFEFLRSKSSNELMLVKQAYTSIRSV